MTGFSEDIRWKQRFNNYIKALRQLRTGVEWAAERPLNELEQQGIIQSFEYVHELSWNLLKDYLEEQGFTGIIGSKNANREAFKRGLIQNGDVWMDMIKSRNLSSHTYDSDMAVALILKITDQYYPLFNALEKRFTILYEDTSF